MIVDFTLLAIETIIILFVGILVSFSMTKDIKQYPNTKREKTSMYFCTIGSIVLWVVTVLYTILENYEVI